MKKKYLEPEFDLLEIKFGAIMNGRLDHSTPEDAGEGGEEGPDE